MFSAGSFHQVPRMFEDNVLYILKMFCDTLLKMFNDNIAWTLCPNVLENVLSAMFSLNVLAFTVYSAFSSTQSTSQFLPHSPVHTPIHILMEEAAIQGANCTSGVIWGSVSFSRRFQHAAQPSPGEPGFELATRRPALLASWPTAAPNSLL